MWGVAGAAAISAFGCAKAPPEDDGPPKPIPVAFEGKADQRYAGTWKTADGRSTLELARDGGLKIRSLIATPKGDRSSVVAGAWLAAGGALRMRYPQSGQDDAVLEYKATLAGKTLTLTQGKGRIKTVYSRA